MSDNSEARILVIEQQNHRDEILNLVLESHNIITQTRSDIPHDLLLQVKSMGIRGILLHDITPRDEPLIVQAHEMGVNITILTKDSTHEAEAQMYERLRALGIPLYNKRELLSGPSKEFITIFTDLARVSRQ